MSASGFVLPRIEHADNGLETRETGLKTLLASCVSGRRSPT